MGGDSVYNPGAFPDISLQGILKKRRNNYAKKTQKPLIAAFMCLVMVLAQMLPVVPCGQGGGKTDNAMLAQAAVTEEEEKLEHPEREPKALRQAATLKPEPTPFTGASGKSGDLDWNITADGFLTISGSGDYGKDIDLGFSEIGLHGNDVPEWVKYYKYITQAEVNVSNITTTKKMFYACDNLTSVDVTRLDTENVTNMSGMFCGCRSLLGLDYLNTENVTDMSYMFGGCYDLIDVNVVSGFKTENVTDMSGMFYGCYNSYSIDVSGLNTSKVTDMNRMFADCHYLGKIDVSNFNTENVTDISHMFGDCESLAVLNVSNFTTENVTDISGMFADCEKLTDLDVSNFTTDNVTDMSYMFGGCSGLTSIQVDGFNTEKVTNMASMFYNCSKLTSIKVDGFKTDNVTNMASMFSNCSGLTSIKIDGFNTEKVTAMSYMFSNCKEITGINVSGFKTQKVSNMSGMFRGCSKLTSLDLSNFEMHLSPAGVLNMFDNCLSLEKLFFCKNLFRTIKLPVVQGYYWVNENGTRCEYTEILDHNMTYLRGKEGESVPTFVPTPTPSLMPTLVPSSAPTPSLVPTAEPTSYPIVSGKSCGLEWNITNNGLLTISGSGDYNRITIGIDYKNVSVPEWIKYTGYIKKAEVKVRNITITENMFYGCTGLTSIDISGLDTSNVTNMSYMFYGCTGLTSIDISGLETGNVTNMSYMFEGCTGLTSIDISGLETGNVTDMSYMFEGCTGLGSIDVSELETGNVINMYGIFGNCTGLTSIDISGLDTRNVTNMGSMFNGCTGLTSINVSKLDTSNVISMEYMFNNCKGLTSIDVSGFNTGNVINMNSMFNGCTGLTSLDISGFNTSKVKDVYGIMKYMVSSCSSLEKLYFYANATYSVKLPSVTGYYWVDENGTRCTSAAKGLDCTMTYLRGKEGEPVLTFVPTPSPVPTLRPTSLPTTEPAPTLLPSSSPSSTQTPAIDDVNSGIYPDSSTTSLATLAERTQFVNGGNVKQADKTKINYKTKVFYTNIQASDIVTTNKKGKTKTKKGKLVAGITTTASRPALDKNRIKDAAAAKIATASISKGKIKVTAKKETGVVYLWVLDTGDAGASACAKIMIKAAPTKLQLFRNSSSAADFSADKKNLYKKDSVEIGSSARLYLYPAYKKGTAMEETKDCTYSISVAEKSQEYFTAVQDASDPYCFIVTAKGLKDNKKVSGKITVQCNENGKKVSFTATALNSVQGIYTGSLSGLADNTIPGAKVVSFSITRSDTEKTTGSFTLATELSSSSYGTTDKPKLYAMASEDGFDKGQMDKGKVKVTSRPSGDQGKIKAKLGKDKKTVTVTAAKKTPAGTSVYYLVVYNIKEGKGYKVIKFTAA